MCGRLSSCVKVPRTHKRVPSVYFPWVTCLDDDRPNGVRDTPAWHPERETVSQSASQPASEAVIPLRRALPLRCRLPARFDAAGTTDGGSTRRCRHDAHQDIQSQIQWTLLVK